MRKEIKLIKKNIIDSFKNNQQDWKCKSSYEGVFIFNKKLNIKIFPNLYTVLDDKKNGIYITWNWNWINRLKIRAYVNRIVKF